MTAIEWLNLLSYRNDKLAHEKETLKKWKETH
jgi:hypothetical protein